MASANGGGVVAPATTSAPGPGPASASASVPKPTSGVLEHLSTAGLVIFFSLWGTLAREGLVALFSYGGASIFPLAWAQGVGCFVMGVVVANRGGWDGGVVVGLGTGFCGSVTTFSTWVVDVFLAFGRGGGGGVRDGLTQTVATLGLSMAALAAGRAVHLPLPLRVAGGLGVSLALFWVGAGLLAALYPPWRRVTFALLLSPPGALVRWYLSRLNKPTHPMPLGTLTANLLATSISAAAFVATHTGTPHPPAACHALHALQDGLAACLSTVSTLAVELHARPPKSAAAYALASWAAGVLLALVIIGPPWWSIGIHGSCVGITL